MSRLMLAYKSFPDFGGASCCVRMEWIGMARQSQPVGCHLTFSIFRYLLQTVTGIWAIEQREYQLPHYAAVDIPKRYPIWDITQVPTFIGRGTRKGLSGI